jgi:hypothetical protein
MKITVFEKPSPPLNGTQKPTKGKGPKQGQKKQEQKR